MEVRLKVLVGKNAGHEIAIVGEKFLIGREEDCHLRPRSDLISRHHCALLIEGTYLGIRDFGSKNGTFVNDARVVGEQELKAGDRLKAGPLEFEILLVESLKPEAKKKLPKVASVGEAAARTAQPPRPTANGSSTDIDIDQFLGPEESTVASQETRVIDSSETTEIPLAPPAAPTMQPATVVAAPPVAAAPNGTPAAPRKFAPPSSAGKDSRDAANDVLKKFFKRK